MIQPAILILAAGKSRRMLGRNKLLEYVGGQPLVAKVTHRAHSLGHPTYVVTAFGDTAVQTALTGQSVTQVVLPDEAPLMSNSLRHGIAALPQTISHVMILLADMPNIDTQDMRQMLAGIAQTPDQILRGAAPDGTAGHPVIFPQRLFTKLQHLSGDKGAQSVMTGENIRLIPLPLGHATTDLDTPEDWQKWRGET